MYKAKMLLRKYKDEILDFINSFDDDSGVGDIEYLAALCDNYNGIHKFVELSKHDRHVHKPTGAFATMDDHGGGEIDWLLHNIEDELGSAEKYFDKWTETKDAAFKALSREELKHAEQLVKIAKTKEVAPENASVLQELSGVYQELLGKLG